jgi:hypothetical protein
MRRVSTIAAIAGTVVALCAPAAAAGDWQPYRTAPFTTSGVCPFAVRGDIVKDQEEARTDAYLPDGTPRIEEFRGPLVIRFTNTATGRSAVRDVSGYGRLHRFADGGSAWYFDGGASVRVPQGNRAYPAGWYVVHGRFRLTVAPDGTRDFPRPPARTENLCRTLG